MRVAPRYRRLFRRHVGRGNLINLTRCDHAAGSENHGAVELSTRWLMRRGSGKRATSQSLYNNRPLLPRQLVEPLDHKPAEFAWLLIARPMQQRLCHRFGKLEKVRTSYPLP